MAKEFHVELGGKSLRLAFRIRDGIELKRRFGKPLLLLVRQDVMGLREEPDPTRPGDTTWVPTGQGDPEVQAAFLWAGVRHEGRINEDNVLDWIDDHQKAGGGMGSLIEPVWRAFFLSGVLGFSLDTEAEEAKRAAASEEGKGQGASAPPTPVMS